MNSKQQIKQAKLIKQKLFDLCESNGWEYKESSYSTINTYRILCKGYRVHFNTITENFSVYKNSKIVFTSKGLQMLENKINLIEENHHLRNGKPHKNLDKVIERDENKALYPFSEWMTDFSNCDMS